MFIDEPSCDHLLMVRKPEPALVTLPMHSHTCAVFDSLEQIKQQFVPFLRAGLDRGEKCLYFIDENDKQFVIDAMQKAGVDLKPYQTSGQFEIIDPSAAHLSAGHIPEEQMLAFWHQAIGAAQKAGFKGFRAAVEMSWALSGKPGSEVQATYESRLTHLMNEKDASVMCLYSRQKFSADDIRAVIHAHPLVVTEDTVLVNPSCPVIEKYFDEPIDVDQKAAVDNLELIRELRQTKRDLQNRLRNDAAFRLLVASVKDYAIVMLDPQGKILTWNKGARRIKGYASAEIVGQHFSKFYTPEAILREHPQKELDTAKVEGHCEEEGWRVRKDGSLFWASVIITALYDEGNFIGFGQVTRDLTERKNAEEAREKAMEAVTKANAELQQLSYVVSHELQEPLSAITSYSRLLVSRYKDRLGSDADEFLHQIGKGARMTARLVDDLWTYARVSKPGSLKTEVYTGEVLQEVKDELKDLIEASCCQITSPAYGDFPTIECNREQLHYVMKELITNAIKHNKSCPRPHVEISVDDERNGWAFNFRDNGPGIDRFYGEQVFAIYQRLDGKPDETATGMGLPICRKIIEEQHLGRIGFESLSGSGAKFFSGCRDDQDITQDRYSTENNPRLLRGCTDFYL